MRGLESFVGTKESLVAVGVDWLSTAGSGFKAGSNAFGKKKDAPKPPAPPPEEGFFHKKLFWKIETWHALVAAGAGTLAWWKLR